MLVELNDVEVANFKHARYQHASSKTSGSIHKLPAGEGLESGWRSWRAGSEAGEKLEGGWREAGGRLERDWGEAALSLCSHTLLLLLLLSLSAPTSSVIGVSQTS